MAKKSKAKTAPRRHSKPMRIVRTHFKLFASAAAGLLVLAFLPADWRMSTRLLEAWDFASLIYLMQAFYIIRHFDLERVQIHADEADEGGAALLIITVATALASVAAIVI